MLANNLSTPTCFAIFELIKFMCFGSTLTRTKNFNPRPPRTRTKCNPLPPRTRPANAGSRNPLA